VIYGILLAYVAMNVPIDLILPELLQNLFWRWQHSCSALRMSWWNSGLGFLLLLLLLLLLLRLWGLLQPGFVRWAPTPDSQNHFNHCVEISLELTPPPSELGDISPRPRFAFWRARA